MRPTLAERFATDVIEAWLVSPKRCMDMSCVAAVATSAQYITNHPERAADVMARLRAIPAAVAVALASTPTTPTTH